ALVPLLLSPSLLGPPAPTRAFFEGWLSGTLAYMGILFWIIDTFHAAHLSMGLAVFCLVLLSAYLGLYWGAWAWYLAVIARSPWRPWQSDTQRSDAGRVASQPSDQHLRSPRSFQSLAMTISA